MKTTTVFEQKDGTLFAQLDNGRTCIVELNKLHQTGPWRVTVRVLVVESKEKQGTVYDYWTIPMPSFTAPRGVYHAILAGLYAVHVEAVELSMSVVEEAIR